MWEPLLKLDIEQGHLVATSKGTGTQAIICLLDPPHNAMSARDYQTAQSNAAGIFKKLQERMPSPLLLGLQEDFWGHAEQYLVKAASTLPENYLESGGFGIIHAMSTAKSLPQIIRLEDAKFYKNYKTLEEKTISFMAESASFFHSVIAEYKNARRMYYGEALKEFTETITRLKSGKLQLDSYIDKLRQTAESLNIELDINSYPAIFHYEKLRRLEQNFEEQSIQAEKEKLLEAIKAHSELDAIAPRAALELYLYRLRDRHGHDEDYESHIGEIEEALTLPVVPKLPDSILHSARELAQDFSHGSAIRVKPDEMGKPSKGYGELLSNLLELATTLGIDTIAYPLLSDYVYYATVNYRFQSALDFIPAKRLINELEGIERKIIRRLAETGAEKFLASQERMIAFMEELGRYHIVHDVSLRQTIVDFDIHKFCEKLVEFGQTLPAGWGRVARDIDEKFMAVLNYYDLTISRGKDMASILFRHMNQQNQETAILYCDGYLNHILDRWFTGHDVSYSFITPHW